MPTAATVFIRVLSPFFFIDESVGAVCPLLIAGTNKPSKIIQITVLAINFVFVEYLNFAAPGKLNNLALTKEETR